MEEHKAIYELLYEFKDWNRAWDGTSSNRKETIDEFVEKVSQKYKIEKRDD